MITPMNRAAVWLVLLSVLLGWGCGRTTEAKRADPEPEPMRIGPEDVALVERGPVLTGALISGQLRAQDQATVRAQLAGQLTDMELKVGQRVSKGAVVARLRAIAERAAVGSAKAAVATAETDLSVAKRDAERTEELVKAGALAQRDLEQAVAAVSSAQARVSQARAQLAAASETLDEAVVRAPITGVVSSVPVNEGDVVSVGAELFTLLDPSTLELQAAVPTNELGSLRPGTPILFQVQGYGDKRFKGQVRRISPAADPETRQVDVYASIPNDERLLIAGLYAEGRAGGASLDALLVPSAAVSTEGGEGGHSVMVVRDNVVVRQQVQLGARDERSGKWEVLSGLQQGDRVLVGPGRQLQPGTRVQLTGSAESGEPAR
jgi:RND family efflux transporter MFP subunit